MDNRLPHKIRGGPLFRARSDNAVRRDRPAPLDDKARSADAELAVTLGHDLFR